MSQLYHLRRLPNAPVFGAFGGMPSGEDFALNRIVLAIARISCDKFNDPAAVRGLYIYRN